MPNTLQRTYTYTATQKVWKIQIVEHLVLYDEVREMIYIKYITGYEKFNVGKL